MDMRKVLFWLHLTAGVTAGIVILIMCVTGVALTYERQINAWLERPDVKVSPVSGASKLPLESLIAKVKEPQTGSPSAVTLHPGSEPVEVSFGRAGTFFADPYTGQILARSEAILPGSPGSSRARAFFRFMEDWHRWLGAGGNSRATGKSITDAANLVFFGIVLSGIFLWIPRKLNWQNIRPSLWFRSGVTGRARDWNWHNVIGIWAWVPLVLVVGSSVIMSYQWASNLLYTATGSPLPPQLGPGLRGGGVRGETPQINAGRGGAPAGPRGGGARGGFPEALGLPNGIPGGAPVDWNGLDLAWTKAEHQVAGWKSIRVSASNRPNAPFNFAIDRGDGGQPQLRATLNVDRQGQVINFTDFSSNSAGAQLRQLARFTHTGETLGIVGQTIAGLATAGGALMVYTGLSLSLRRLWAWRRRRSQRMEPEVAAEAAG
jgi:uncharacterized iron-regulated membrane protein